MNNAIRSFVFIGLFVYSMAANALPGDGDISGDGKFSDADITMLRDHLLEKQLFTSEQFAASDVNEDYKIDIADVVTMVKWSYGTIRINIRPEAGGWTLTGPEGFTTLNLSGDMLGAKTIRNAPIGIYTLTCWDDIPKYDPPPAQMKTLTKAGAIDFDATWTLESADVGPNMIDIPAGTFTMGRGDKDDDVLYGRSDELPRHEVTLSAYQIGKYEVTVGEVCRALNWAASKRYISAPDISPDNGFTTGSVVKVSGWMVTNTSVPVGSIVPSICLVDGVFKPVIRKSKGGAKYSMESFPASDLSFLNAVVYCNWLSEGNGLTPCYDSTNHYELKQPVPNGYRLPSEAEWERAAGWGTSQRYVYGISKDFLNNPQAQANIWVDGVLDPFGFGSINFHCTPIGWYNGLNISPIRGATENGRSPVGCYDMCGNVYEWCQDWYGPYSANAAVNPFGPSTGDMKVTRGGSSDLSKTWVRTAARFPCRTGESTYGPGFRVARYR